MKGRQVSRHCLTQGVTVCPLWWWDHGPHESSQSPIVPYSKVKDNWLSYLLYLHQQYMDCERFHHEYYLHLSQTYLQKKSTKWGDCALVSISFILTLILILYIIIIITIITIILVISVITITVDIIIITVIFVIECNATGQRGIYMRRFARGNVRVCRPLPIFCWSHRQPSHVKIFAFLVLNCLPNNKFSSAESTI